MSELKEALDLCGFKVWPYFLYIKKLFFIFYNDYNLKNNIYHLQFFYRIAEYKFFHFQEYPHFNYDFVFSKI